MLDASAGSALDGKMTIQSGANSGETLTLDLSKADLATTLTDLATGMAAGVDTAANATIALDAIDVAIQEVSDSRAYTGAVQNRLDYTINNLNASAENTQAAESRIRDVDYAEAA